MNNTTKKYNMNNVIYISNDYNINKTQILNKRKKKKLTMKDSENRDIKNSL